MYWTCDKKSGEKKVITEGGCESQYPAAVYSPGEQGVRPGSIALSFFAVSPLPLLITGGYRGGSEQLQETFITELLGGSLGHRLPNLGSAC